MTEQPKTVVCTSCSAKFHVPDELVRGKVVTFRCRKCGAAIDVDGRRSARPAAPPPPPAVEIAAVDTPATFSQRTLPPPRPPSVLSKSSPSVPWPEPPRTRTTTAPTTAENGSLEESLPRLDNVRDLSNRGPKIAAVVALLMAAGLSGIGLAMRESTPGAGAEVGSEGSEPGSAAQAVDPQPAIARTAPAGAARLDNPHRLSRTPTRVTDLPSAVDGVEPPTMAGGAAVVKPSEAVPEMPEPAPREAVNVAPLPTAANAVANPAEAPAPSPGAEPFDNGGAPVPAVNGFSNVASPQLSANAAPPTVVSPAPAARAKGDFNTQAAREALDDAAGRAGKCRNIDTPSGTARVAVTFAPNGHVTNAVIESGPFVGTSAGSCVAAKFRSAKVPPFSGDSVLVRKTVPF